MKKFLKYATITYVIWFLIAPIKFIPASNNIDYSSSNKSAVQQKVVVEEVSNDDKLVRNIMKSTVKLQEDVIIRNIYALLTINLIHKIKYLII